ncbi:hypothetical protein BRC92_00575 [Halobacteriales archaeon QS_4_69_31]|nr:MAG: hypothetical protein BRC92_00575 [Halobacteriales archaeon QS_4_69_31]
MTHRYGDERIVEYLQQEREWKYPKNVPYHPRSDAHGGAQCRYFLDDLLYESDLLREAAESGDVVFQEDYEVGEGGLSWNTDLVMGPPEGEVQLPLGGERRIAQSDPDELWLALDAKSIMTEHQKARRNRVRDINSFADIMHHHHERAIAGGVLLINLAERFDSPTRDPDDITDHPNVERIVDEILDMFRAIDRSGGDVSNNLDGAACVVVRHTNLLDDDHQTKLVTDPPAPQPGDEVHYQTFVGIMRDLLESRFLEQS